MAEKGGGGGSLLDERRCKRSDGKKWRCQRVVMEGRTLCEAHFLQGRHRQHKKPVPDDLKLERQKRSRRTKKFEENPTEKSEIRVNGNVGCSNLPQKRGKRKNLIDEGNPNENLEIRTKGVSGSSNRQRKRGRRSQKEMKSSVDISEDLDDALKKMKLKKGDLQLDLIRGYLNRQIEKKKGKQPQKEDIVKELKYGRLEISQSSPLTTPTTSVNNGGLLNVKVGIPASTSVPTRFFRSKNIDRLPIATMQILPSIKANVKATTKKCHWCSLGSYRVLVKCLTCKKQFFCEDCIRERYLDKADIKKRCPVCHGNCSCRVCIRGRSKEVKTKDLIVFNGEEKFDKAQQLLYMIDLLLPLLEQINQEKIIELEIEAKIKDKRKSLCTILRNWSTNEDGSIKCPPKNLGGCGDGILGLFCHPPVNWTKDLEARAKEIVCASKITQYFEVDSSRCALCDEQDHREGKNESEILINNKCLYFSIRQDLGDKNLQHFTKHWVRGQPLILRDMINSESELSWDPISMFCMYLERSAKSRNDKEVKLKNCSDWCEVQIGRQQIFMGGKTHANVWHEKLKFKVWLSSGFFQEHFPSHYAAAMHALPIQQYINPLTGILNLAANMPPESQNPDLGPFVYISYGRTEDLMGADFLTKLCYHAYDMKKLNKVKVLLNKYSSQDQNEFSEKNKAKNEMNQPCGRSSFSSEVTQQSELEDNTKGELTQIPNGNPCAFSDDSSISESDDEDLCHDESGSSSCNKRKPVDTCGAQWDVFRRQDSCVNVVLEFISPESASMGTKLSDETRQLPVNHKAKGKMLGVKKMTIHSVNAAVEEFRAVSQAENESLLFTNLRFLLFESRLCFLIHMTEFQRSAATEVCSMLEIALQMEVSSQSPSRGLLNHDEAEIGDHQ
ncbi:WRC-like protein [Cynara cardunculus var. scolymus]|uniref:WRC-like protein n=1 Tax=Cynara cardunculus var. scolymus TaxID=59895 RepID=A0A103XF62_CYNCS|nr:WRC-like protein [Cynara cardunculus var. scolymus]